MEGFLFLAAAVFAVLFFVTKSKSDKYKRFIDQLFRMGRISYDEYRQLIAMSVQMRQQTMMQMQQQHMQQMQASQQPMAMQNVQPQAAPDEGSAEKVGGEMHVKASVRPVSAEEAANTAAAEQTAENVQVKQVQTAQENVQAVQQNIQAAPVQQNMRQAVPQGQQMQNMQQAFGGMPQQYAGAGRPMQPMQGGQYPYPHQVQGFNYYNGGRMPVQKRERKLNSAAAMLLIGTAFVILAGIVFSTAAWLYMSEWQRVGVMLLASAFFFGVSAAAHKKLKLESTGMAFYMLGGVFTAITFVTMGYFELLGDWLAVKGDGFWLLYAFTAVIVSGASAGAVKIYKKGGFVHGALYSFLVAFTLMSVQVFDGRSDWWAFTLNLVAAVPIYMLYKDRLRFGELYDRALKMFAIVIAAVYGMIAVPELVIHINGKWTAAHFMILLVWTVQLIYYGIKLNNEVIRSFHVPLVILAAIELMQLPDGIEYYERAVLIAAIVFAAQLVNSFEKHVHCSVGDVMYPQVMLTCGFVSAVGDAFGLAAAGFGMALVSMLFTSYGKSVLSEAARYVLIIPMLLLALAAGSAAGAAASDEIRTRVSLLVTFGVLYAAALFFRYGSRISNKIRLRTAVSDIGFVIVMYLTMIGFADENGKIDVCITAAAGLLSALLVMTYVYERKPPMRPVVFMMRLIFPVSVIILIFSVGEIFDTYFWNTNVPVYCAETVMLAAAALAFIKIVKIRTPFSDFLMTGALYIFSLNYNMRNAVMEERIFMFIGLVTACALCMLMSLDKNGRKHVVLLGIAAPIPLLTMASELERTIRFFTLEETGVGQLIMTAVICAAAAVMTVLAERNDIKKLVPGMYAWSAASVIAIFMTVTEGNDTMKFITAGICAVMYIVFDRQKYNIATVGAALMLILSAISAAGHIYRGSSTDEVAKYITLLILFALFAAASRLLHGESLCSSAKGWMKLNTAAFAMAVPPLLLVSCVGGAISDRALYFTFTLMTAAFFANLVRKANRHNSNLTLTTMAVAALCISIYTRPVLLTDDEIITGKINLLPILIFGFAIRYIWREMPKVAGDVGFAVHLIAFVGLIFDALVNQTVFNTILVLTTAITIMLISFALRNGRWFAVSAAAAAGLTLYITRDFLAEIEWWVYLLLAGLLLIGAASANEYMKTHGGSMKDRAKDFSQRWKK